MTPIEITVGQTPYDWWDLVPAIVGGIIGALAGGIPAWLLARRASREALERDRLNREEVELVQVFRVHTKLGIMVNDLTSTLLQIREMLARSYDPRDESPTQRRISAFAGKNFKTEAAFAPDELAIFMSAARPEYLTELDLFSRRYFADMEILDTYGRLKAELHDLVSDSDELRFGEGDRVSTSTVGRLANKLRMKARTLESIIVPCIAMMERDARNGINLAEKFDTVLKPHFPHRKIPGFEFEKEVRSSF